MWWNSTGTNSFDIFTQFISTAEPAVRGVRLAKNDFGSVFGLVWQKPRFSVRFRFYQINRGFGFSVRFLHCMLFNVYALYWVLSSLLFFSVLSLFWGKGRESHWLQWKIFHLCLYGMRLEMVYFHDELVQLIISRSDSELEVQRLLVAFAQLLCTGNHPQWLRRT